MGFNTESLRGLCSDGLWKYAVFWSIKSEKHGILTWEDGYVDKMTKNTRDHYGDPADSDNQIITLTWSNDGQYQSYPFCPIEAALLRMSSHSYSLGEEIIGKVAIMGRHCWISSSDLRSTLVYKYHEDWQFQFAAGIKTVLLVPVIPYGVLHLGSLCMVLESSALATHMKDLFYKIYNPSIPHNPSATGFGYSNSLKKPAADVSVDPADVLAHDLFDVINNSAQLFTIEHLSLPHPFTPSEFPMLEDVITGAYNVGLTTCSDETFDANESDLWTNVNEAPSELTHCKTLVNPDMTNLSFMDKLINSNSKLSCTSVINIQDADYNNIDDFILAYMAQEYQEHTCGSTTVLNDDVVTSNSSIHSKMHKDLEAIPKEDLESFMWHGRLKQQESTSHSLLQANGNKAYSYSHLETNDYAEFLVDAITNQVGDIPNSYSYHLTDSSTSSETQIQREDHALRFDSSTSCETQIQREDHALSLEESTIPDPSGGREFSPTSVKEGFMTSKMTVSLPKGINRTMTEECVGHTIQDMHREISVEIKHEGGKKELHRPRPRDRQLIQDRMKELRELIPNASKCSIDALLDKTITQMLFLQSVSEKAEKLQNKTRNEKFGNEAKKKLENCPLRVEELEEPGHLLIEILCKEYDVFFETAHLFKGLEVSILKGELEHRSDQLWARFVVEASKCSNQMQILCPLMHLLQRR
ncbi:hypothetical protein CFC21_029760 [Triticum aestivum]|uniref:BHLH domain-containing protein n=3 Tax=Triticinae TaxID=1648030 RepID=A0A453BQZ3_AEGTS|nr:transcription factor EMB1444 isoform X2 [Aegilops tauschii subsp. strangulata]KAF7016068.1 hypothetical protein CFC21_029760 [Triticum aestivum]